MSTNSKDMVKLIDLNCVDCIKEYEGGHALISERFNYIVDWISETAK